MLPLLEFSGDGEEHRFRDAVEQLASIFGISDTERAELLPSGTAPIFDNRVGWARTYLKQAGLLRSTKRGEFQITEAGRKLLSEKPGRIDVPLLDRYQSFRDFRSRRREKPQSEEGPLHSQSSEAETAEATPEDALATAYAKVRANLEAELLDQVRAASPAFFERLVIDVSGKNGIRRVTTGRRPCNRPERR